MQQFRVIGTTVLLLLFLSACDGGSGSNNNSRQANDEPPIDDPGPNEPPIDDPLPEGLLVYPPVSGLEYSTETIKGVTGPDGSFDCDEGETVRFTLGDTLVGEVACKGLVTPFDLAGSPVVTGMEEINIALESESDPFHGVINTVVLLQSLDEDADPANGIAITEPLAALFDGVQLDLGQDWRTFPLEYWLRYVLGQANSRQLFSQGHWITNPAIAINHLYRALRVDARTFGQDWEQSEDEGRVNASGIMRYDANGNLTLREVTGTSGRISELESWTYDDRGNLTALESHQYADESIETSEFAPNGSLLRVVSDDAGGEPDQEQVYEYDTDGKRTRVEWTGFEGEADSRSVWQYDYDQAGRLSRVEQVVLEVPGEELQPVTTTYSYDAAGRLTRLESSGDLLGMTAEVLDFPEHQYLSFAAAILVTYEYSSGGQLIGRVMEGSNPQYGSVIDSSRFNERGDVIWNRMQVDSDFLGDGDEINAYEYRYDSRGNITRKTTDHQADGGEDITETWQYDYDANGNVTRVVANDREYREPHATLYFYDSRNNVIRREFYEYYDEDAQDPREIVTYAYEYHPNGGIAVVEQRAAEEEHRHSTSAWSYDAIGRLVREELDQDIDGVNDAVVVYEYDDSGILVYRRAHGQEESDGSTEHWQYDPAGNLRRHEWHNSNSSTGFEEWEYDAQGRVTRYQIDCEGACIVDYYDGSGDDDRRVVHYEYDDLGNKIRESTDTDADGRADTIDSYEYDARGNLVRSSYDDNGDGTENSVVTYAYDANDNLTRAEEDHDGDGSAEQVTTNEYDDAGNLLKEETVERFEDRPAYTETRRYQYDDNGNPTRFERLGDEGNLDFIQTWQYDNQGNLVSETQDEGADGRLEQVIVYQYDERGNLVREARSEKEDEPPGWLATYEYDAEDNLVRESEGEDWDLDGDMENFLTRTYVGTGWGHILGNPVQH